MSKDAEVIESFLQEKPIVILPDTPDAIKDADIVKDFVDDSGKLTENEDDNEETPIEQSVIQSPGTIQKVAEASARTADNVGGWLKGLPTPGGIGALLFALIFFVWVIIPVNEKGDTRLRMLWGVLTGGYGFKADYIATTGPTGSDFGESPQSDIETPSGTNYLIGMPLYHDFSDSGWGS